MNDARPGAPGHGGTVAAPSGLDLSVAELMVHGDRGRIILLIPELHVAAGTCLGVAGPSGAGKTTFLYCLSGLARDATGAVRWGGTNILRLSPGAQAAFRRDHLGIMFQDHMLFDELNAVANASVACAFLPASRRRAVEARARVHLRSLGVPLDGRRKIATYSGGERQRIALARALAVDPKVVLADEPTASLDAAARERLIDDLVGAVRETGKTLVCVSHDRALLDQMDRVVTIVDGSLSEGRL